MSQHHRARKWANHARKARAIIGAQLPLPCVHCGAPVYADVPWDVGHVVDLADGGDTNNYGASHRRCNRSAGGTAGANAVNRRKKNTREW